MKNLIIIAVGVASFLFVPSRTALGQASATGHITAEVIEAITAFESTPLSFGRFATGDLGGTIVVPADGAAMSTSTVVTADSQINPATFTVSGAKDATFTVTLPVGPATLTSLDGNGTLEVTDWTATSGSGSDAFVLSGGTQTVKVGATLKVGTMDQNPKGIYTGSYKVTFAYN